jgi:DUF1365 family protein
MATVDGRLTCGIAKVDNTFGERKAWFLGKDCLGHDFDGDAFLRLDAEAFLRFPFSRSIGHRVRVHAAPAG